MPYHIPASTIKASKLLLSSIVSAHGGTSAVAHILGKKRQEVNGWVERGFVPLSSVHDVAKGLKVSQFALSFVKLLEVFGAEVTAFRSTVHDSALAPAVKKEILKVYGTEKD